MTPVNPFTELSEREMEKLKLIAAGLSNSRNSAGMNNAPAKKPGRRTGAERMTISQKTVKYFRSRTPSSDQNGSGQS
jgi:hypothetical protein